MGGEIRYLFSIAPDESAGTFAHATDALLQLLPVKIEVGQISLSDSGDDGCLGNGRAEVGDHAGVKRFGDDVISAEPKGYSPVGVHYLRRHGLAG